MAEQDHYGDLSTWDGGSSSNPPSPSKKLRSIPSTPVSESLKRTPSSSKSMVEDDLLSQFDPLALSQDAEEEVEVDTPTKKQSSPSTPPGPPVPPKGTTGSSAAKIESFSTSPVSAAAAFFYRATNRSGTASGSSTPKSEASTPRSSAEIDERKNEEGSGTMEVTLKQKKKDGPPAFDFQRFLEQLKSKSADPVSKYLKSFLTNFAKKSFTMNEMIKLVHDFLQFISARMKEVEPWKSSTDVEFDNALEAMEKLVMNRLYPFTFTPQIASSNHTVTTDDLERDSVLLQRIRLFHWIKPEHLDVIPIEESISGGFIKFAGQELAKVNHYKAPRDKLICILNCCKVIFGLIRHASTHKSTGSADAFIPLLIYVVLQTNPEHLISNVEYINRFRSAAKLQSEAGYYLSSLSGSITFIESMDHSSLSNITKEEFEANVEKAITELPPASPLIDRTLPPINTSSVSSPFSSTADGEEQARQLPTAPGGGFNLNPKEFFMRTGDLAQAAVSKPLSAIGRIFTDALDSNQMSSERDVDQPRTLQTPHYQPRVTNPRPPQRPVNNSQHLFYSTPPPAPQFNSRPNEESPQSQRQQRQYYEGEEQEDLSQLQEELNSRDEAIRAANVSTILSMFPDIDPELASLVLDAQQGDLGSTIDSLLEMAEGT